MTSPLWQRSDGQLLKALRQEKGLDASVLARMGTMTVQQLRGLEEGEGGEFYSPEIKAHMGRSLLAKLGYVPPPVASQGAVDEAPAVAEPATPPVQAVQAAQAVQTVHAGAMSTRFDASPRASGALGRTAGIALASAALIAIAYGAFTLARPAPAGSVAAAPTAPAAATSAPLTVAAAPVTAAPALPVAAKPEPVAVATAAASADPACTPADTRPGLAYTPTEPRKAGNFVHLVADKPVRLCVVDASQKATRVELEPGMGRSVPGAAPFVVRGDLAHLRIFFQGVRVQGDLGASAQVVLNEAPLR